MPQIPASFLLIGAQAAALASLAAEDALRDRVDRLLVGRTTMIKGLRDIGHAVPDSQGNFVWLPTAGHTHRWANAFVDAGVMVRPYASDGPYDGIRITVGEPEANELVLEIAARLSR